MGTNFFFSFSFFFEDASLKEKIEKPPQETALVTLFLTYVYFIHFIKCFFSLVYVHTSLMNLKNQVHFFTFHYD